MTIDSAVSGLPRNALVEAIYRASRIVSETQYDFDNKKVRTRYIRPKERLRISNAVAEIITEIENASEFKVSDLPDDKRAEVLSKLYASLAEHIIASSEDSPSAEALIEELHSASD